MVDSTDALGSSSVLSFLNQVRVKSDNWKEEGGRGFSLFDPSGHDVSKRTNTMKKERVLHAETTLQI